MTLFVANNSPSISDLSLASLLKKNCPLINAMALTIQLSDVVQYMLSKAHDDQKLYKTSFRALVAFILLCMHLFQMIA